MKRIIKWIVIDDDGIVMRCMLKNILRNWCGIKWRSREVEQNSHLRSLEGYGNEKVLKKFSFIYFVKKGDC